MSDEKKQHPKDKIKDWGKAEGGNKSFPLPVPPPVKKPPANPPKKSKG